MLISLIIGIMFLILGRFYGIYLYDAQVVTVPITGYGIGYWLWLASMLSALISSVLLSHKNLVTLETHVSPPIGLAKSVNTSRSTVGMLGARPSTGCPSWPRTENDPIARLLAVISLVVSVLGLATSGLSAFYTKLQADVAAATLEGAREHLTVHIQPDSSASYQPSSAIAISAKGASMLTRWVLELNNDSLSSNIVISHISAVQTPLQPVEPSDARYELAIGVIRRANGTTIRVPIQLSAGETAQLTVDLRIDISLVAARHFSGIRRRMSDMDMLASVCKATHENEFGDSCVGKRQPPEYTLEIETSRGHIYSVSSIWHSL